MAFFVEELGDWESAPPTVGGALLRAKQRYYNSVAAASLSNYDEKVLGVMTLYGLPMLRVNMPVTSSTPLAERAFATRHSSSVIRHSSSLTSTVNLTFTYTAHNIAGLGTYYTIAGENDIHISGGRPIQPRTSRSVHLPDTIAHGALMLGGSFADVENVDPVVSRVVTEQLYIDTEPTYPLLQWFPGQLGTVNRFLAIDGQSRERLVVVPGQFKAASGAAPTLGTQRLYHQLAFELYHAPITATDFIAPSIWQVEAIDAGSRLTFRVLAEDDSGVLQRTLVLYRPLTSQTWSAVELSYDPATGTAEGSVPPVRGPFEYFAQAVDPTGNVALALDHGLPFRRVSGVFYTYLPLVLKRGP
jgi:hypothetical protein